MTPGGSAGTAAAGHRVEPAPTSELHEQIRQCLDDEVLMATGRSVGDIASGHVADALLAGPLAPLLAKLRAVEALAEELDSDASLVAFSTGEWDTGRSAGLEIAADRIREALS